MEKGARRWSTGFDLVYRWSTGFEINALEKASTHQDQRRSKPVKWANNFIHFVMYSATRLNGIQEVRGSIPLASTNENTDRKRVVALTVLYILPVLYIFSGLVYRWSTVF